MDKKTLNIPGLNLSKDDKDILENVKFIPVGPVGGVYLVDEAYFLLNVFSDNEKRAFYNLAIELNNE